MIFWKFESKPLLRILVLLVILIRKTNSVNHRLASIGMSLKAGREVTVLLYPKKTSDFYFNVKTGDAPLSLMVTPCGGMVKWKLAQQIPKDHQDDLPIDENLYEERDDDPFISSGADRSPITSSLKDRHIFHQWSKSQFVPSTYGYMPIRLPNKEAVLVREVGRQSMEYNKDSIEPGVLHLYLSSADNATAKAKLFVHSATLHDSHHFPMLPRRRRVHLQNISKTSVTVTWDRSPTVHVEKQFNIKYTVILNPAKQYLTYCEFESENQNMVGSGKISGLQSGEKNLQKVGSTIHKTEYHFSNLIPDTKYYVSLFAVNRKTDGAISYEGASFVTRTEKLYAQNTLSMKDNKIYASYLNPTRASFRMYKFSVPRGHSQLLVAAQSCTGYIRVHLYKDGSVLRKSVFDDLKTFLITNLRPSGGEVRLKVINDDNDAKLYKIWASVDPLLSPYPSLPPDTSVRPVDHGRTCNSVELAWLAVQPAQHRYCLYKKTEDEGYFKKLILEQTNQCRGPPPQTELVECVEGKNSHIENAETTSPIIMKQWVGNLRPGTTYRFDLYVSKPQKQQLSYRTIWVKTKMLCDEL